MSDSVYHHRRAIWLIVAFLCALFHGVPAPAQLPVESDAAADAPSDGDGLLRFAFEGTPWREVIQWLASESDAALHIGELPTGSFTYSDPDTFTPQEAIDRINLFLLPQGFTVVRSGRLLSVINLGDPRSMQQLDSLAEVVTAEQLEQLDNSDVVKCFFPLGEFKAEDAVQELSPLQLMTTPAVFAKTNRLLITDTVGKLRSVKAILDAFQPSAMEDGTVMKNFPLQHADAEDILVVARPHLGLATGEMIGIDVSLSADLQGKNIFVTGAEDKVKLIEGLITDLDRPVDSISTSDGENELRSHLVPGGNVETVYNVLQTLLAGKSVRLSMDETAGSIVALATPDIQSEIADTVAQLEASEADFEVIPLKSVDPYFAISLLEEMLDLPGALDDPDEIDPQAPKIDADPGNMRLFVRAKTHQIEQIKKIIEGLDADSSVDRNNEIRLLALRGKQAEQVLETAAKFWRAANPIILYQSPLVIEPEDTERVVNGESTETVSPALPARDPPSVRLLTDNTDSQAATIRCQLTPRGVLLQSDDAEALDQFEELVRTIAGPFDSMPSPPIVFYLRYAKPDDAIRVLAELLDGGVAAREGEAGSLVNAYVSSGSSGAFLSSLVTSREGTTTMIAGSMTVVADSRLNRLIAQGTASDIELIESYLKIIDKDSSITSIEVYGTSHVIELFHTRATDVAAAIRDAYAGRVASATGVGSPNQAGSPGEAQRDAAAAKMAAAKQSEGARKAPEKKSAGGGTQTPEPKMTIAVHEPSNSLIVTAPEPLFREVEQLVKQIDSRSEETVEAIAPVNSPAVRSLLQDVLSNGARTTSSRTGSSSRPPSPSASQLRSKSGR